jgi:hypothetical protein
MPSSETTTQSALADVAPAQREQPQSDIGERSCSPCAHLLLTNAGMPFTASAIVPHDTETYIEKQSKVSNFVASSLLLVSDAMATATAQARGDPTHQLHRASSTLLYNSEPRPIEADASPTTDDHTKPRQSRFRIR